MIKKTNILFFIAGACLCYLILRGSTEIEKKKNTSKINELKHTIKQLKSRKKETITQVVEVFSKETGALEKRETRVIDKQQIEEAIFDDKNEKEDRQFSESHVQRRVPNSSIYGGVGFSSSGHHYVLGYEKRASIFVLGSQVTCCSFKSVSFYVGVNF